MAHLPPIRRGYPRTGIVIERSHTTNVVRVDYGQSRGSQVFPNDASMRVALNDWIAAERASLARQLVELDTLARDLARDAVALARAEAPAPAEGTR